MNRQVVAIAVALFALLASVVTWVTWQREDAHVSETELGVETEAVSEPEVDVETWTATLYYPGSSGWLHAESREIADGEEVSERVAAVVTALLAGPRGPGLRSPLPDGVGVKKVYLVGGGTASSASIASTPDTKVTAYLDLESPEGSPPPATGSSREMLTIYSLVNTVLLNFEEVDRLVLLWNGSQLRTFAGHLDTRRPLVANPELIVRASSA